jgi:hypothetical protein
MGEVVLTLTLDEADQLQTPRSDEAIDVGNERLDYRIRQRRRGVVVTAVTDEKAETSPP